MLRPSTGDTRPPTDDRRINDRIRLSRRNGVMTSSPRNRRSIRFRDFDYTTPGAYFVTICVQARQCLVGAVENGQVRLTSQGIIVEQRWRNLPRFHKGLRLDEYVVMPNHLHDLLILEEPELAPPPERRTPEYGNLPEIDPDPDRPNETEPGSVGTIVQNFKSIASRAINSRRKTPEAGVWQRNYYEHIVRDQADLESIRAYIRANPENWNKALENPDR